MHPLDHATLTVKRLDVCTTGLLRESKGEESKGEKGHTNMIADAMVDRLPAAGAPFAGMLFKILLARISDMILRNKVHVGHAVRKLHRMYEKKKKPSIIPCRKAAASLP